VSVKIHLHLTHRHYAGGLETVETEGNTVGDCMDDLLRQYPGLGKELFEKKRKLKGFIELYLNSESTHPDELSTRVEDGDEIQVLIMLAGG